MIVMICTTIIHLEICNAKLWYIYMVNYDEKVLQFKVLEGACLPLVLQPEKQSPSYLPPLSWKHGW